MNKIKILDKEFKVGDMVRVHYGNKSIHSTNSIIGYVKGVKIFSPEERALELTSDENGINPTLRRYDTEIIDIKKLVYER